MVNNTYPIPRDLFFLIKTFILGTHWYSCGYSLEAPRQGASNKEILSRDASNEYPASFMLWRTGKNYPLRLIWVYIV